ncbi:predicted protein, partial [Nematostella vectensis]
CCPEPYPNLVFTLHIRRKVLFYFNNLIVPCFLITAFALLTFVLPPNTGERVTLVITTLLAMTVFMLMIAENTPTTSDVTPLIGKFFVASMVEIGLALIATCFVLNIYESTGPSEDVPNWLRTLLLEYLAPLLRVTKPKEKPTHKIRCNPVHDRLLEGITILTDRAREQEKVEGIKEEWESVARVIDRLFLLLFIATVAISTAMIFLQRPSYATM